MSTHLWVLSSQKILDRERKHRRMNTSHKRVIRSSRVGSCVVWHLLCPAAGRYNRRTRDPQLKKKRFVWLFCNCPLPLENFTWPRGFNHHIPVVQVTVRISSFHFLYPCVFLNRIAYGYVYLSSWYERVRVNKSFK